MANPSSILHPRRSERGGVSWVTILLLAAVVGGTWLFIAWTPIYVVHYEVKQVVREYMNQALKSPDDAALVEKLCAKLRSLDTTTVTGEDGTTQRVPSVVVTPADVTWERDVASTPPTLRVAFEYVRQVHYPFLAEPGEWIGAIDLSTDLTLPDWGPAR